jgi:serine/threonine-protein kinase
MNDTSPSLTSGMLLAGKYRIDRTLGEGGMGIVVAATNEALRQRVAIKLLRTGALANAKALGRFEREARAAASLRSEHVARVLDVGKLEDGRPFMVMEYLEGCDLGDVIDQGPMMPVSDAVDYVLQACEAIAEAHAAGIIHRDLKPKNLFHSSTVDGRPLVKVLDFGISKMDDVAVDMSLTRTTEIIGSPSYMSPEQLRASKEVDLRTDIWALGVILFELLTKRVPFHAVTVTELVAVVLTEPVPDIRIARPDVPPALADAILRCLAKSRDQRFASVTDLVCTIAPFGRGDPDDTIMDRVARVAAGSGRSLPSTTGSGPQLGIPPGTNPSMAASHRATAPMGAAAPPAGPSGFPEANGEAPPPASSARLNIHGGTSVAWGETQVDAVMPRGTRRSRRPLIAAAAGGFVLLTGAGTGAIFYVKRAGATPAPLVGAQPSPAPPASMTLPSGRKDLPPATTAAPVDPSAPAPAPVEAATGLPSSRVSTGRAPPTTRPARPHTATGATGATSATTTAATTTATPVAAPPTATPKPGDDLSNIGRR